jgi:3-oxoacyl-[acyl-carrier protein] reductase
MELGLHGKVAIVGGASQGIGFAIARELAQEGALVTIAARKAGKLEEAAARIRAETGGQVLAVPGDWTKPDDCARFVDATVERYGRLDLLVNNDGAPPLGELVAFDDVAWQRAIERNFLSAVRMIRLSVPHMRAAGAGRIVNITASSAKQPIAHYGLSVATWAGLLGYAKTLSLELAPHAITVNTILPGRIVTERLEIVLRFEAEKAGRDLDEMTLEDNKRIPLGHPGTPDDISGIVAFLLSERGRFITGTAIQVDGGTIRNVI